AWPVHGLCGIWGSLSLGLFACGKYAAGGSSNTGVPGVGPSNLPLTGLFYKTMEGKPGGFQVLWAQMTGSFIVCVSTFAIAMAVFLALKAVGLLRISKEGEMEGMDLHEHGISAYPEYVISALSAPSGMPRDTVNYVPSSSKR